MAKVSGTPQRRQKNISKDNLDRKNAKKRLKRLKLTHKNDSDRRSAVDNDKRRNNDIRRSQQSLEMRQNRDLRRTETALERRQNRDLRRTETALERRQNRDLRRTETALERRQNRDLRRTETASERRQNNDFRRTESALERRQNNDSRRTETSLEKRQNNDSRRSLDGLAANRNRLSERIKDDKLNIDYQIKLYEEAIRRGPTFVCQCCGCLFFVEATQTVKKDKIQRLWTDQFNKIYCLSDGFENILLCITCARDIKSVKVPRLCLNNGYWFSEMSPKLIDLTLLEERLVAPRLPFMQIRELKIGKQFKIRGNVVNVPISVDTCVDVLPRTFDKTETVQLKLKRMKRFKHDYINEFIRPAVVYEAAKYLIGQPLYQRENINLSTDWEQLYKELEERFIVEEADKVEENQELENENVDNDQWDETIGDEPKNPNKDETLLKEGIVFAPGEGQRPVSLLYDKFVEELSFPKIFCGKERIIIVKHSYSDICRSELRRADRRCCNPTNIFFKYRFKEMDQQKSAIQTFLRKGYTRDGVFNAQQAIDDNFISNMVNEDQAYKVLVGDRSSPAYWHSRMRELMSMIRQIGIPTLFLTLSAAETHWAELLVILVEVLRKETVTKEEVMTYSFEEKSELIRKDPVTTARYFDHRIRQLFKVIRAPCGPFKPYDIADSYIRVEFQSRGSPHIHCLLWLRGAPVYNSNDITSIENCEKFIDEYISCGVGSMDGLERFQYHKHSQTCKKNTMDSVICRFGIPQYPMGKTLILEPLKRENLSKEEDRTFDHILDRIEAQLKLIDECVKKNDNSLNQMTFSEFLNNCQVTEETYIRVIRTELRRAKVFLKRSPIEIRTNAYHPLILKLHRANMDLQFILDPYACVHYILNYINKSDRGMSTILRQVVEECKHGNIDHKQKLYRICSKFINCSEVSVQEAVYILLRMQLSRSSRDTIFINTGEREFRTRILKMKKDLEKLDPDSIDIFSSGLLDYYMNRPDELESCSLADFAANYTVRKALTQNRDNEDLPENTEQIDTKSKGKCLKNGFGILIPRKNPRIIRYRKYQLKKEPLQFYREKVMLYLPWRNEDTDILMRDVLKLYKDNQKAIFSIEKKYVFDALLNFDKIEEQIESEIREYNQTMNEDIVPEEYQVFDLQELETNLENELRERTNNEENRGTFLSPTILSDDNYLSVIRSLNEMQRNFLLGLMNTVKTSEQPFNYFLSGGAGVGKSLLIKAVFQSLSRWYNRGGTNPDDIKVLLVGPTGKSAFNIRGTTIHSAFHMHSKSEQFIKALSPDLLNTMRKNLWHLKVIICDEVSMVGSKMLSRIDCRCKEIFNHNKAFGGISIIFVGDLNQLPPVSDGFVFRPPFDLPYGAIAGNILWSKVRYYRLNQIMRQKDDLIFAEALNRLSIGQITESDKQMFRTRLFPEISPLIPQHAIRLYKANRDVDLYNSRVFMQTIGKPYESKSIDFTRSDIPFEASKYAIAVVENMPTKNTYGLPNVLKLKIGVLYMISTNIDIKDGLCNGTSGRLMALDTLSDDYVNRLWLDFEDIDIGSIARTGLRSPVFTQEGRPLTPINRVIRDISSRTESGYALVSRKQFPLVIAEAITIHKSQGQTYEKVVIDMTRKLPLAFFYTALSRAKTLDGLYLVGDNILFPEKRSEESYVHQELLRLESEPLQFDLKFLRQIKSKEHLVVFYQNIPFLRKHSNDLSSDVNILSCDILALVETRSHDVLIEGFELKHELRSQTPRPFGISLYFKTGLNKTFTAKTFYELFEKSSHFEYMRFDLTFALCFVFYVSPTFPKNQILPKLEQIFVKEQNRNLFIIGDWNIEVNSKLGKEFCDMMRKLGLNRYPTVNGPSTDHNTTIDYLFSSFKIEDVFYYESLVSDHKPLISLLNVHSD